MIQWRPITDLPDGFDNERDMLLWLHGTDGEAVVGSWSGNGWEVGDNPCPVFDTVTHFAEINPPS